MVKNELIVSSGIKGLDTILPGGYPAKKTTLIVGESGTGKTILSLFFLLPSLQSNEKTLFVTCSEPPENIVSYLNGFGFPGTEWVEKGLLKLLDYRPSLEDKISGEYELTPMLLRIRKGVENTGASRLVIDTLENLHLLFDDAERPREELQKLFDWARQTGITSLMNCGTPRISTQVEVLEEYYADCVVRLYQRVENRLMTRLLRISKMRGTHHGTNEYPFSIDEHGVNIFPISETLLTAEASKDFVSTGLPKLDQMLGGKGYHRGSIAMVSGMSGTGKSTLAAQLCKAALAGSMKGLYVSFEESKSEILRNMSSIGIDLSGELDTGKLVLHTIRAVEEGLETHLINLARIIDEGEFGFVVFDPITAFMDMGSTLEVKMMLLRLIDFLKSRGVTAILTELITSSSSLVNELFVSSLTDLWFRLRLVEDNGEFNRLFYIRKSKGLAGSNQVKEIKITGEGIIIEDPYVGAGDMVFGTAKAARREQERAQNEARANKLKLAKAALAAEKEAFESHSKSITSEHATRIKVLEAEIMEIEQEIKSVETTHNAVRRIRD